MFLSVLSRENSFIFAKYFDKNAKLDELLGGVRDLKLLLLALGRCFKEP